LRAHTTIGAVVAVAGLVALAPAAAQAATKTVTMGPPLAAQAKLMKHGATVNDFFPHGVTVNVGDSVEFVPAGFHTLDIPAKGQGPDAFALPTGDKVSGSADAAGQPFWFNGLDVLSFNPALFGSLYGKTVTYDRTNHVQSGLPLAPAPKPVTVKFAKAGRVTYFCSIHPGMKGTVHVKRRGAKVRNAKQDAHAVKVQVAKALKIARSLAKRKAPKGTVEVGLAGAHGVEYFDMLPAKTTVKVGDSLRFRMKKGSFEAHTATFGPGNPETEPESYLGQIAKGFEQPPFDPRAVYPSDVPGPATLTTTLHGNGFWNSGLMDAVKESPLPGSNTVTFGQAGTYTYYCLLHPFMRGTVEVK
jgi:plastocyanin